VALLEAAAAAAPAEEAGGEPEVGESTDERPVTLPEGAVHGADIAYVE